MGDFCCALLEITMETPLCDLVYTSCCYNNMFFLPTNMPLYREYAFHGNTTIWHENVLSFMSVCRLCLQKQDFIRGWLFSSRWRFPMLSRVHPNTDGDYPVPFIFLLLNEVEVRVLCGGVKKAWRGWDRDLTLVPVSVILEIVQDVLSIWVNQVSPRLPQRVDDVVDKAHL